jgi:GTP-binding protein HflX
MAQPSTPENPAEKAYLVAVDTGRDGGWTTEESLIELAALAETAGATVVGQAAQKRAVVHPNWYLGKGKAAELTQEKGRTGFTLLVTDDELSPKQQRSLETLLNVKVLDRSGLILDIFAQRARTAEGRLQVELAQLEYQLPRLTRLWAHLSRTGGGIGTRGPGETQLETDRRIIRLRIKKMKERVEAVRVRRETAAQARDKTLLPTVAIVGYTNAGKSTLLNALVGDRVVATEDKLFATLDPTSRRVVLGEGRAAIVSDTVGFIHKLPHQLVEAFRATLEEVIRADVHLLVADAADPRREEHLRTVQDVLDELGAGDKPRIIVANKVDLLPDEEAARPISFCLPRDSRATSDPVAVSAADGRGIEELRHRLAQLLADLWVEVDVAVPYTAGELLARVRERGSVSYEYGDTDVRVRGRVVPSVAAELETIARRWQRAMRRAERREAEDREVAVAFEDDLPDDDAEAAAGR